MKYTTKEINNRTLQLGFSNNPELNSAIVPISSLTSYPEAKRVTRNFRDMMDNNMYPKEVFETKNGDELILIIS